MPSKPAIEAHDLTRRYGDLLAVDHINFQVHRGEIFGFLGPNGAGKTTTVRMLTTLLEPTEGTAFLNGYDVRRQVYQAKRQFGIVPEESNVYTELSAMRNLLFAGQLYRVPRSYRKARAFDLLSRFGLGEKADVKVENFSKGMRRRLTIAMSLMHRPNILFLDEPTSGLDVQSARMVIELVRELNQTGMTIFLTTHRIEEAEQLCDRIAIINHGTIAAIDKPERLKRTFQTVQSVEIALEPNGMKHRENLAAMPGVNAIVRRGDKLRLYTSDPPSLLPMLIRYAEQEGVRVVSLNTLAPSLEDAFLLITGQQLGMEERGGEKKGGRRRHGK